MTTQQPNLGQAIRQLIKAIVTLVLIGMFAWACLSIHTGTTTPATAPSAPPPTAQIAPPSAPSSASAPMAPPPDLITPEPQTYTPAPTWSPGEADFLIGVHNAFWDWPFALDPGNDGALVNLGYNACKSLISGMSEPDVIDALGRYGPTATRPESDIRLLVHLRSSTSAPACMYALGESRPPTPLAFGCRQLKATPIKVEHSRHG